MATRNFIVSAHDPNDSIELIDDHNGLGARIRIRERAGKASIYLSPGQLEEHARACLEFAEAMRSRHG